MRQLRFLLRQPAYLAISLVQAVVWLPLFGSLFRSVSKVPGFGGGHYIDFLTPGVVTMCVLFSSGWAGMGFIQDMDRGVMERLLASPARRWAIVGSTLAYQAVVIVTQVILVVLLGWALGAHFASGLPGIVALIVIAVTLSVLIAALSDALALVVRKEQSLIAASNFLVLPLTFLSTAMMPANLLPDWIRVASWFNPANWAVTAARQATSADPGWGVVFGYFACLATLAGLAWILAVRAFGSYQRSL